MTAAKRRKVRYETARAFAVALVSTEIGQRALRSAPADEAPLALASAAVALTDALLSRLDATEPQPKAEG